MNKLYIPLVKQVRITKSRKRIKLKSGVKEYKQLTITLPKEFADKLDREGVETMISITNSILICIPPNILLKKKREELLNEFDTLLRWLKRYIE